MPALPKVMVEIAIRTGASARAEVKTQPRFKAGDKVVARNINPAHTHGFHAMSAANTAWFKSTTAGSPSQTLAHTG